MCLRKRDEENPEDRYLKGTRVEATVWVRARHQGVRGLSRGILSPNWTPFPCALRTWSGLFASHCICVGSDCNGNYLQRNLCHCIELHHWLLFKLKIPAQHSWALPFIIIRKYSLVAFQGAWLFSVLSEEEAVAATVTQRQLVKREETKEGKKKMNENAKSLWPEWGGQRRLRFRTGKVKRQSNSLTPRFRKQVVL